MAFDLGNTKFLGKHEWGLFSVCVSNNVHCAHLTAHSRCFTKCLGCCGLSAPSGPLCRPHEAGRLEVGRLLVPWPGETGRRKAEQVREQQGSGCRPPLRGGAGGCRSVGGVGGPGQAQSLGLPLGRIPANQALWLPDPGHGHLLAAGTASEPTLQCPPGASGPSLSGKVVDPTVWLLPEWHSSVWQDHGHKILELEGLLGNVPSRCLVLQTWTPKLGGKRETVPGHRAASEPGREAVVGGDHVSPPPPPPGGGRLEVVPGPGPVAGDAVGLVHNSLSQSGNHSCYLGSSDPGGLDAPTG